MKYLLLAAFAAFVWWIWSKRSRGPRPGGGANPAHKDPERIVACAHCGVHIPESESVRDDGGVPFCCAVHRDARGAASR
jgi:uncharacterized protein